MCIRVCVCVSYQHAELRSEHRNLCLQLRLFLRLSESASYSGVTHVAQTHTCHVQTPSLHTHTSHVLPHGLTKTHRNNNTVYYAAE